MNLTTPRKVINGDPSVPHLRFIGGRWFIIGDIFLCYWIRLIEIFLTITMIYNQSFTARFMHIIINKISLCIGALREIAAELVNQW